MTTFRTHFYGHEISQYGRIHGLVDYQTFAKTFNHILHNDIMNVLSAKGFYFEEINGADEETEIFQCYIVEQNGADIIEEFTNDPLFYCEQLDMYVWGVTHFGTSWDYVLTTIPCEKV